MSRHHDATENLEGGIMSEPTQQKDEVWTFPEAVPARGDLVTAELVKKGIELQDSHGTDFAAEYLKANGIAMDVAMRVLSRRSQRRKFGEESK
jgi:hypothetical protein